MFLVHTQEKIEAAKADPHIRKMVISDENVSFEDGAALVSIERGVPIAVPDTRLGENEGLEVVAVGSALEMLLHVLDLSPAGKPSGMSERCGREGGRGGAACLPTRG